MPKKVRVWPSGKTLITYLSLSYSGVDGLQDRDGECGCFTRSRLCLGNDIPSLEKRPDCSLLDGWGFLEPVGVNSSQQIFSGYFVPRSHWTVDFIDISSSNDKFEINFWQRLTSFHNQDVIQLSHFNVETYFHQSSLLCIVNEVMKS